MIVTDYTLGMLALMGHFDILDAMAAKSKEVKFSVVSIPPSLLSAKAKIVCSRNGNPAGAYTPLTVAGKCFSCGAGIVHQDIFPEGAKYICVECARAEGLVIS